MRNKLLGAIAAVAAGAGATSAQTAPPAPMPIGPAGGPSMAAPPGAMGGGMGGAMPGGMPGMMPGGMPGMAPGGMGGMMPGGMPGGSGLADFGGEPGYPAGTHGQPQWAPDGGLFGAPAGVNSRLASRAWVNVDYLLWFNKSQPNANNFPLLTTSAPAAGGVPGRVSTRTLAGDRGFGYDLFSGYRIDGGFYCDDAQRRGVYFAGFQTEQKANITSVASDATGQPLYARPFLNSATGGPDVLLVSFPTFAAGSATVYTASEMYGAEGGSWTNLYRACPEDRTLCNLNFLAGFRYMELHEQFRLESQSTLLGANTAAFDGKLYGAPATIGVVDEYEVYNRFYGGQVGFNTELRRDNYFVNATAKVALGVMNERLDVRGFSTISNTGTGADAVVPGGLYANSTNSGRFRQDEFCVIPEFTVNFGYQWATWLTTTIGYNYLYVSRVARPGEQITTTVNPATVPTSPSFGLGAFNPVGPPQVVQSDYWMQGIQFGLVLRY